MIDTAAKGESLIPKTLEEMSEDVDFQATLKRIQEEGQQALTREEKLKRQRSLDNLGVPSFQRVLNVRGVCLASAVLLNSAGAVESFHCRVGTEAALDIGFVVIPH